MPNWRQAQKRGLIRLEADKIMKEHGEGAWWEAHVRARTQLGGGDRKVFDFYSSVAREIAKRTGQEIE